MTFDIAGLSPTRCQEYDLRQMSRALGGPILQVSPQGPIQHTSRDCNDPLATGPAISTKGPVTP